MFFSKILTAMAVVVFMTVSLFASDKYVVDRAHTNVGFTVRHMLINNVPGKFQDFDIVFNYDENNLENSSVKVTIQTASIDTDNEKRDNHLRSDDFFNAEKYPEIIFVSDKIVKKGDGYVAEGTLTIRDVSRKVELPFNIIGVVNDPWGNTKMGVEGGLTINRKDYDVNWSKTLDTGGLVVSDEVNIKFDVQLQKEMES